MSRKIPVPPKTELQSLYETVGSSMSSVARHYHTSKPTVKHWLEHYSIALKSHQQASQEANLRTRCNIPPKEEFETLYRTSSIKAMEEYYGVGQSTIYEWLFKHNISVRTHKEGCSIREYITTKISKWEQNIYTHLITIDPYGEWQQSDRKLIAPKEIDIISYKRKLAIECCGVYWHSELFGQKPPLYHMEKLKHVSEQGITLITLFDTDNELHYNALLNYKLGRVASIGARETTLKQISHNEADKFHITYHAAGAAHGASQHYGLYDSHKELTQVLSLGASRFSQNCEWELHRFTNRHDLCVVGGLSKLWSHFLNIHTPQSVVTYADRRFGTGQSYVNLGFRFSHYSKPNYWYFQTKSGGARLHSRVAFQKHKLAAKLSSFDPQKTEWENMQAHGYDRIWDCGNAVYTWHTS